MSEKARASAQGAQWSTKETAEMKRIFLEFTTTHYVKSIPKSVNLSQNQTWTDVVLQRLKVRAIGLFLKASKLNLVTDGPCPEYKQLFC